MTTDYNKLDTISLDVLNTLLLAKKLKRKFVLQHDWDDASIQRDIEKKIESKIGFSTSISELEAYIRESKIRLIINL